MKRLNLITIIGSVLIPSAIYGADESRITCMYTDNNREVTLLLQTS